MSSCRIIIHPFRIEEKQKRKENEEQEVYACIFMTCWMTGR